jgi:hypothetical protein
MGHLQVDDQQAASDVELVRLENSWFTRGS